MQLYCGIYMVLDHIDLPINIFIKFVKFEQIPITQIQMFL